MEHNSIPGGLFSGMNSGMLGLEMPLHQPQNPQNSQNPSTSHQLHHPNVVSYAQNDPDPHPQQSQQTVKHGYPYAPKPKQPLALSDEDDPGCNGEDSNGEGKRKSSPWQRMKWTDTMVRLLIMAVYYVGDECGSDANDPTGKKKTGALLQKKGKWKSVSRAMMEKGYYVSPQQCEDKFNDLNKRYKRVNDILGKGTACKVVENQSLLETMDLSPKLKEEARKLLNSKHLFFREMCAYHSICGHGVGGSGVAHQSTEMAAEPSHAQRQQAQHHQCHHSTENASIAPTLGRAETEGSKMAKGASGEDDEDYEDEDSEDEDDEDEEEEEGGFRGHNSHGQGHDDEDEHNEKSRKRPRLGEFQASSPLMQQLNRDMTSVLQDGTRSAWDKKQWIKVQLLQLEEQQIKFQYQAFELEKQRLKWIKFSSKKEREMEKAKLENERRKLENERMVLIIRQKEMELPDLQQQQFSTKRGEPSSVTG